MTIAIQPFLKFRFAKIKKIPGTLFAMGAIFLVAGHASAASVLKADGQSAALNTSAAWVSGVPPTSTDVAVWDSTVLAAYTLNLGATTNWGGIQILNPAGAVTITNVNTMLIIGPSGVDTSSGSQALTLSCPVALVTNNANIPWNLVSSVTLGGGLNGTNILEKSGSGTLFLGTATVTSTVQVDAGIAQLNTGSGGTIALNGGTVNINVAAGNPINVMAGGGTEQNLGGNRTWSGALSGSGPLSVVASSIHTWTGNNTAYAGTLTESGTGSLRLSSASAVSGTAGYVINGTMNGNVTGVFNLGSLAGSGTVGIAGGTPTWVLGALGAGTDFSGNISGAGALVVKVGAGTQTLSGANAYTGNTVVSNGVLQIGDGGSGGALASPAVFLTNIVSILSFNRNDAALDFTNMILGIGQVQQNGSGTIFLSGISGGSGANSYSGGTVLNGGVLKFTAGALGTGGIFFTNNAALQWAGGITTDISSQSVTLGNGGGTLDVNGNTVTLANAIGNNGPGALTVKSTAANGILNLSGANTYSGGTMVSSGTLAVNNTSGSGTGPGSVTVSGGTLGGTGTISGAVDVQSVLAPGTGSVGTLTVGSLTLESGCTNDFQFASTPANSKVVVTASGGFAVNGGMFNLYQSGGTLPWTTPGTYTLFQYSGPGPALDSTWTTASAANPHVANPQAGLLYAFAVSGGSMTVTITTSGGVVFSGWNVDADGNWSDATKWSSNPNVPHAAGDTATLGVGSALRTITLNANEASGTINFTNSSSFVIANAGNTLTLDNSGAGALVNVTAGTANAIQTAVSLNDNTTLSVTTGKSLAVSGAIGNSSTAKSLTVNGGGTVALSGNNTYGPAASSGFGTVLSGGTLQVGNNNALGAGDVSVAASGTLQAGTALSLANNFDIAPGVAATVDNNGNSLTLGGVISDSGGLTKVGNGTLTLSGNNTYSGNTTVNAGILSLSADANVGGTPSIILNGGTLRGGTFELSGGHSIGIGPVSGTTGANALIDAASGANLQVDSVIASAGNSGTNGLIINGLSGDNGTVLLNGANTFNGVTAISNGTLQVMNALALQNSTLNFDAGNLVFDGGISAATFGNLAGTNILQNLVLTNLSGGNMVLSVGRNNATTAFFGNISGSGALTKQGTGMLTLSNANYTGATVIGGGAGILDIFGGNFGSATSAFGVGTGGNMVSNATMNVSSLSIGTAGGQTGAALLIAGNANETNATGLTIGSSGNTGGNLTINTAGSVSLGTVLVNRDAGAVTTPTTGAGLIIDGGTVTAGSVSIAQSGVGGRGADLNINGGSLTVGDSSSTGVFAINSTTGNGFITISGGLLNYSGTDGLLMSVGGGLSAFSMNGGMATLTGVTLNSGNGATVVSTLNLTGVTNTPALYLGSVGLVANQTTTNVSVILSNAIVGAIADWSSSVSITLNGNATLKCADASSVAHNISLSGILSGPGGLTKTGNGTLTLSGANSYVNHTVVAGGLLDLTLPSLFTNSTVSVSNGATLKLDFAGTNIVGALVLNGVSKSAGSYGNATDPAFLTGAGILQVVPVGPLAPTNAPAITGFSLSGNNITLAGTNGNTGATYYIINTTNLANPLVQWKTIGTNVATGNTFTFIGTNAITPGALQQFYRLSGTNYNP